MEGEAGTVPRPKTEDLVSLKLRGCKKGIINYLDSWWGACFQCHLLRRHIRLEVTDDFLVQVQWRKRIIGKLKVFFIPFDSDFMWSKHIYKCSWLLSSKICFKVYHKPYFYLNKQACFICILLMKCLFFYAAKHSTSLRITVQNNLS